MSFEFTVNWNLPFAEFEDHIEQLIRTAKLTDSVIPITVDIEKGRGQDLIVAIISQVDCSGCDSRCCRRGPEGSYSLNARECERLGVSGPADPENPSFFEVSLPCKYLSAHGCSIHNDVPAVCAMYPFQAGGTSKTNNCHVFALSSACPEAARIALKIYLYRWRLRKSLQLGGYIP